MKKMIRLLLFVMLLLFICTAAFADDSPNSGIVFGNEGISSSNIKMQSVISVNENVYAYIHNYPKGTYEVHYWTLGMTEPTVLIDEGITLYQKDSDGQFVDETNMTHLFTDGSELYGFDAQHGGVRRLVAANGSLPAHTPLYQLKQPEINEELGEVVEEFVSIFAQDQVIYLTIRMYTSIGNGLVTLMYNLSTGALIREISPQHLQNVYPYKEGKLLMTVFDEVHGHYDSGQPMPYQLMVYDIASESLQKVGDCVLHGDGGFAYSKEENTVYFVSDAQIYSFPDMQSEYLLNGYLSLKSWQDSPTLMLLNDHLAACMVNNILVVREMNTQAVEKGALHISGNVAGTEHTATILQNPTLMTVMEQVAYQGIQDVRDALDYGSTPIDIMALETANIPVAQLIDEGYAADLSGYPELMEIAMELNPVVLGSLMEDGKLYGIPAQLDAKGLGYDKTVLEELGLTEDELPDTYIKLLTFIEDFEVVYQDSHPNHRLFAYKGAKGYVFDMLVRQYAAEQMRRSEALVFNTDLFRKLIRAFEQIDFEQIDAAVIDPGSPSNQLQEYRTLFTFHSEFTDPRSYTEITPLVLPLETGLEPLASIDLSVMVINAKSEHIDQAAKYLAEYAQNYSPIKRYPYMTDYDIPLASDTKVTETMAMQVSEEAIALFRKNVSPYLYVMPFSPLYDSQNKLADELLQILDSYKHGSINAEEFISEMDAYLGLMDTAE